MMPSVPVPERITADNEGEKYHPGFEVNIRYDIDTE
jgi:hypothetical protein